MPWPTNARRASCRTCKAPVVWAEFTATGRAAPVDAEPVPDGNLIIERWRYDGTALVTVVGTVLNPTLDLGDPEPRYKNHFATCPDAQRWRRD